MKIAKIFQSKSVTYGGFHKWGYPNSWMVCNGKSCTRMDDLREYPCDLGNLHISYPCAQQPHHSSTCHQHEERGRHITEQDEQHLSVFNSSHPKAIFQRICSSWEFAMLFSHILNGDLHGTFTRSYVFWDYVSSQWRNHSIFGVPQVFFGTLKPIGKEIKRIGQEESCVTCFHTK